MINFKFTIFTPCYNGKNTIKRVFESVASQTYKNYEWIIINDGSTDKSDSVIRKYISDYNFAEGGKIKYLSQNNKGKHVAWNRAVDMATGELFLSADADDSFIPTTLEYFNAKMNKLLDGKELEDSIYSGINVCVYDPDTNEPIGTPYPYNGLISDNVELDFKYKIRGEHWGIVRTDLLRKNKFPEVKGHFYTEGRIWYSFAAQGYTVVCYNDCLRARYNEATSLTHNRQYIWDRDKNIMYMKNTLWTLHKLGLRIFRYSPVGFLRLCKIVLIKSLRIALSPLFYKK